MKRDIFSTLAAALLVFGLIGCSGMPGPASKHLRVLALNSIVADVVAQVGGPYIDLSTLMPLGTDPHEYTPQPHDVTSLAQAQVIFANGAGLEASLQPLIESAGATSRLVDLSSNLPLLTFQQEMTGKISGSGADPHTWMDPNNVIIWTENIAAALASLDPAHATAYSSNAKAYQAQLRDLDGWIRTKVQEIPATDRLIVSDHAVLGYFAARYGFTTLGTINGSFSSDAAPSAQELAALENVIKSSKVRAIFVTEAVFQNLANQVAGDTGIQAVWLYHATLTDAKGPVPTYLKFMEFNTNAIASALK